MSARRLLVFVMVLAVLLAVGWLPVAASGGGLSVQMDKDSASLVAGDWVEFSTVLQNEGTTATPALVAHLNIASLDKGRYVDPEDWSPERTRYVAPIAPGDSTRLAWKVHALTEGSYAAFVTIVSPDRSFASVAGSPLGVQVEPDRILPLGEVIPTASLVPVFPLALFLFSIVHRRRRSAAALPIACD